MSGPQIAGIGAYTIKEAAHLLGASTGTINRWIYGALNFEPLWTSQWEGISDDHEIGFRDLMEARIIHSLRSIRISLQHIRKALEIAREEFKEERPFSTSRFRTDGKRVFWEAAQELVGREPDLTDVSDGQKVFWSIVLDSFVDLEIEGGIATRWWPEPDRMIVLDPARSFGQPILSEFGVPTRTLVEALEVYQTPRLVSRVFEVPERAVKAALKFEAKLAA